MWVTFGKTPIWSYSRCTSPIYCCYGCMVSPISIIRQTPFLSNSYDWPGTTWLLAKLIHVWMLHWPMWMCYLLFLSFNIAIKLFLQVQVLTLYICFSSHATWVVVESMWSCARNAYSDCYWLSNKTEGFTFTETWLNKLVYIWRW